MDIDTLFSEIKSVLGPKELFLILIGLIILLKVINSIINNYVQKKVRATSKEYLYVKNLSENTNVELLNPTYRFQRAMNSKTQLDHLNVETQLMVLFSEEPNLENLVHAGKKNQNLVNHFLQYKGKGPPPTAATQLKGKTTFKNKFIRIESALVIAIENSLVNSVPKFSFVFTYTSPKGRNTYKREFQPSIDVLESLINKIHTQEAYKQTAQYQRSLMSPSLRYEVMCRDGFRCVLCGRKASDGVRLHVDHIRPVSRGGKTELSNLRTLCQDCNLGKGAKYNPNGYN